MQRNQRAEQRITAKMVHPQSRHIKQTKATQRHNMRVEQSREGVKTVRTEKGGRFTWFKGQFENLRPPMVEGEDVAPLTMPELRTLAHFLTLRNDEELAELKSRRNPPTGMIKQFIGVKEKETNELRSAKGLEVPKLNTQEGVDGLLAWDGYDKTVEKVPSVFVKFDGDPNWLVELSVLNVHEATAARPGAKYQEASGILGKISKKADAPKIEVRTAHNVEAKVGAKAISTEQVLAQGRARRLTKQKADAKRRFHQQITLSRGKGM